MTGGEIAQIVTACAALIGALSSLRNGRAAKAAAVKVAEIHEATNGLVEKLGNAKLAQGDAEGHARAIEEGRQK
jgi:hypothetical protein